MKKLLLALTLGLLATSAAAQTNQVYQSGSNITPNQVPYWVAQGVIGGAVTANDSPVNTFGITANNNSAFCISSQRAVIGNRQQMCFGVQDNAPATISLQNYGTDNAQQLNFQINGITYPFPGSLSQITISSTPVVGGINGDCLIVTGTTVGQQSCATSSITALTGDVTAVGPGSAAATLATVNPNAGNYGSGTQSTVITVNGKGLITAASQTPITATASSVTVGTTGVNSASGANYLLSTGSGPGTLSNIQAGMGLSATSTTLAVVNPPGGRLTPTSGTPVLKTSATGVSTLYYDCFKGGNAVPVYNGTNDIPLPIGSCEISVALQSSGSGVESSANVFDVWAINVSGTLTLCVATNGSGGGWASDSSGSNTARGSGYSALDFSTRSYITNKNSITNCYTGATNNGPVSANRGTYVGTFYTTANGQTGVGLSASGTGGGAPCVCIYNPYNTWPVSVLNIDSAASWTYTTNTWRLLDSGTNSNNYIAYVDGLGYTNVVAHGQLVMFSSSSSSYYFTAFALNWSSGAPPTGLVGETTSASALVALPFSPVATFLPSIGYNTVSWLENCNGNCEMADYSVTGQTNMILSTSY